jgi:hypothetical protein
MADNKKSAAEKCSWENGRNGTGTCYSFNLVAVGRGGDEWPFRMAAGVFVAAAERYRERPSATGAPLDVDNFFETAKESERTSQREALANFATTITHFT